MSVFTSLIIVLVAMVIQASLQLAPGFFAIFYHHSLGKTSKKKADDRALSFILGVEIATALIFLAVYIIISFFVVEKDFLHSIFLWVMSGLFLAETVFSFFWYFRPTHKKSKSKSASTELFFSRYLIKNLITKAETVKNRSDTILLGIITCALELPLTLPLYIISSILIPNISLRSGFLFIIAYIIIATIPLFIIRNFYHTDHNLAEIQRIRVKNKPAIRLIISASYLTLAILTFIIGVSS